MPQDTGVPVPPPASVYRAEFTWIEGNPAVIAAIVKAPVFARNEKRVVSPPVVAVVAQFDLALINELQGSVSVSGLRVSNASNHTDAETGIQIPVETGEPQAWLHWQASRPGTAILQRIAPALGIITLFFGCVSIVVLRTMRRSNQELAVSERRAVEMAYRDPLTGLANRLKLVQSLDEQIPALPEGQKLALFFLDLDGFKDINDTLGHPVGDELLAMVGERLEGILGSRSMTVRFGGDEFALLAPISDESEIAKIA
jgi:predicted signal transduction protein with EAL and GGDEF domain